MGFLLMRSQGGEIFAHSEGNKDNRQNFVVSQTPERLSVASAGTKAQEAVSPWLGFLLRNTENITQLCTDI
jgi:hypothetical protein